MDNHNQCEAAEYRCPEHISLLKYTKSSCGVDFFLNTATNREKRSWFDINRQYRTDFFEFYFFSRASGFMLLNGERIDLHDSMALIVMPFQQQEWHVDIEKLDYTFLIFHEEFVYNFISDKYFMYRLLYCYQHDYPTAFAMSADEMAPFIALTEKMKHELHNPIADSYHMIVAYLYEFLLLLNRFYAGLFNLPLRLPINNYAFQYKSLLEKHIREKAKVSDYAAMIGISRVALNNAVFNEFGVTAKHLLKQRLLQEVKNDLLFSGLSVKEIAANLNFSAPNHLMRFFKLQTGKTVGGFVEEVKTNGLS